MTNSANEQKYKNKLR